MELQNGFNNPQQPHRILLEGQSGSGKTYSALLLAQGLTGGDMSKVVLIDTTGQPSSMYAHLGHFSTIQIGPPFYPARFNDAMEFAHDAGAKVIILDSLSDQWSGEGGVIDRLRGDAYETALQAHRSLLFRIRHTDANLISTVRTRTKIVQVNGGGKWLRRPLQMPIQDEGIEQHFSTVLRLRRREARAIKDSTGVFQNNGSCMITPEHGNRLRRWHERINNDMVPELTEQINNCTTVPELHRLLSRTNLDDMGHIHLFTQRRLAIEQQEEETPTLGNEGSLSLIRGGLS